MKILIGFFLTLASTAFAIDFDCSVSAPNIKRQNINAQHPHMGQPDKFSTYNAHNVGVAYMPGNRFEPQSLFTMQIDKVTSQVYSVSADRLYRMTFGDGTDLQCYVSK